MKTKFDIGDIVAIPAKIYEISIWSDGSVHYKLKFGDASLGLSFDGSTHTLSAIEDVLIPTDAIQDEIAKLIVRK